MRCRCLVAGMVWGAWARMRTVCWQCLHTFPPWRTRTATYQPEPQLLRSCVSAAWHGMPPKHNTTPIMPHHHMTEVPQPKLEF